MVLIWVGATIEQMLNDIDPAEVAGIVQVPRGIADVSGARFAGGVTLRLVEHPICLTIEAFSSERQQQHTQQDYHGAGAGLRRTQRRLLGARPLRAGRNERYPVRKPAVVCCNALLGSSGWMASAVGGWGAMLAMRLKRLPSVRLDLSVGENGALFVS